MRVTIHAKVCTLVARHRRAASDQLNWVRNVAYDRQQEQVTNQVNLSRIIAQLHQRRHWPNLIPLHHHFRYPRIVQIPWGRHTLA